MKGDFTRDTFDSTKHYSSVRLQQGRVQLDADWNEQADILNHRIGVETVDVIGVTGAPLNKAGFQISLGSPVQGNLLIGPGRFYVDGVLCENESLNLTVATQPDLPWQQPLSGNGTYLIYLDVWHRHITALEDPAIREVALGGPDTATRVKTVWQVKSLALKPNGTPTCASQFPDWDALVAASTGTLRARAQSAGVSDKPCIVPAAAGYQRLENQLYRVEVHTPGDATKATFKWSRDNGSIEALWIDQPSGNVLKVSSLGRDSVLNFASGQYIELIDDTIELAGTPGTLVKIIDPSPSGQFITVDTTVDRTNFPKNPRIRRWDSVPGEIPVARPTTNDGYIPLESGVEVRFEDGTYKTGDYWLIPARTNTGDIEWPQESPSVPAAQHARGIRHHFARLALIQIDTAGLHLLEDCRKLFPPLTTVNNFFYLGGDGQEIAPDPVNPGALLKLAQPLRAGAAGVPAGAKVRFAIKVGNGRLQGTGPSVNIALDAAGVAECAWELDSRTPVQMVEANLVDGAGKTTHLPIHYTANLSRADLVSYNPAKCSNLAGAKTVQDALDILCQTAASEPGFHVKALGVHNGNLGLARELILNGAVTVAEIGRGLIAVCDENVDPKSVNLANCYATVDVPLTGATAPASTPGFTADILAANVRVAQNAIVWIPTGPATTLLNGLVTSPIVGGRVLVRFTIKGSSIWAADNPDLLLDGDIFADPRVPTGYRMPSGDKRRGGDLEVWFFLALPSVNITNFTFAPAVISFNAAGAAGSATATLTFSGPVPTGGMVINLASSIPDTLAVPATLSVAAGASTATFTVRMSRAITQPVAASVTAAHEADVRAAAILLTPIPVNLPPLTFSALGPVPPPVAQAQGTSEPVGEYTLLAGGGTAGKNDVTNLVLRLNVPVTNLPTSPPTLQVDNPTPAGGVMSFNGSVAGNVITFAGVTVMEPGATAVRTLRVTNVRANASALGAGGTAPSPIIGVASINVVGAVIVVQNPQQVLATLG